MSYAPFVGIPVVPHLTPAYILHPRLYQIKYSESNSDSNSKISDTWQPKKGSLHKPNKLNKPISEPSELSEPKLYQPTPIYISAYHRFIKDL